MHVRNVMTPFMAPGVDARAERDDAIHAARVDARAGRDDASNGTSAADIGLNIGRTPRADAQCSLLLLMEFSPP